MWDTANNTAKWKQMDGRPIESILRVRASTEVVLSTRLPAMDARGQTEAELRALD